MKITPSAWVTFPIAKVQGDLNRIQYAAVVIVQGQRLSVASDRQVAPPALNPDDVQL